MKNKGLRTKSLNIKFDDINFEDNFDISIELPTKKIYKKVKVVSIKKQRYGRDSSSNTKLF